ncbi:hypothetical protein L596_017551 [Steinernema carpocapsae]|uniref:Uncharacterized protein n=1 Tax=Steinernema carpocapsae TaxID=34508 RepID=A0A4U5N2C2_STECR|nr:hypothetical protein L596_017551 [Steinernema carpocapsae]
MQSSVFTRTEIIRFIAFEVTTFSSMDFLPTEFHEELLLITTAIWGFNTNYTELKGAFGLCTSLLNEKTC